MTSKLLNMGRSARCDSIDLMKFILSIFVAIIHLSPFPGIDPYVRPILRTAVPLFFITSSYFFFLKHASLERLSDRVLHLERFVKRNLKLYLFWFVVLLPVTLTYKDWFKEGALFGLLSFARAFLFGSTFRASWYIMAGVIAMVLVVVASRYLTNRVLVGISVSLFVLCCMMSNYSDAPLVQAHMETLSTFFGTSYNSFWVAICWTVVGKVAAEHAAQIKSLQSKTLMFATCISFLLLYAEHYFLRRLGWGYPDDCYLMLPAACLSLFIMVSRIQINIPHIDYLRVASTVTYCLHFSIKWPLIYLFEETVPSIGRVDIFMIDLLICWIVALVIWRLKKRDAFKVLRFAC